MLRNWLLFVTAYLTLLTLSVGIGAVYPGDEQHFLATSRLFAGGLSWDLLRTYPEMSGPLPFMIYAAWGSIFGWSLPVMRTCSLLIGMLAFIAAWQMLNRDSWRTALLGLNPYWAAMSVFVYTDMLAVLSGVAAFDSARRRRVWLYGAWAAMALLSRQYLVFLTLAVAIDSAWRREWALVLASLLAMLPLGGLILLWGGLAPDSVVRVQYLQPGPLLHANALLGYIGLLFAFLLPWLVLTDPPHWDRRVVLVAIAVSFVYWLAPVRPSTASVAAGIHTVGLLDRLLHVVLPLQWLRDIVYQLCLAGGILVLARLRCRPGLAAVAVGCFLAVMPFSYLYWEKYMLPLLPFAVFAWGMMDGHETGSPAALSTGAGGAAAR